MQQEKYICRLCLNLITYIDSEVIEKVANKILEVILPNLHFEETYRNRMCKTCSSNIFAAFSFKRTCMRTEDIILPYINAGNASFIELKDVYAKENGYIHLIDISENQRVCRLCLQLVTYGFMLFNKVDNSIIDMYIPLINISATKDPVICRSCFDSLHTHGGFIKNCLEAQKKYKIGDMPHIKTEVTEIQLEGDHNFQEAYGNVDMQSSIKSEEVEIKSEEGDQNNGCSSHSLDEETVDNKQKHISENIEVNDKCEAKIQINECETPLSVSCRNRYKRKSEGDVKHVVITKPKYSSEIKMYKCDTCTYETKRNCDLRDHQLSHKDPSEIQMYKCDMCDYESRYRNYLKRHQLTHKDPSEIQMYKCCICTYESKYKNCLKNHQLTHKDLSEIEMYKCDTCTYKTKRKGDLRDHQLSHKDPSEIQMYKCGVCDYETKYRKYLKKHQLTHKNPSDIQMYRCDACEHETKTKGAMKCHQLVHKHPSEIQMYRCDTCTYETKYKWRLKVHQVTHKDPSETQMYKCDGCSFETKFKHNLKLHQIIHKDPSEIQMFRCDACGHVAKRKGDLKRHQLSHKDPSEIQCTGVKHVTMKLNASLI